MDGAHQRCCPPECRRQHTRATGLQETSRCAPRTCGGMAGNVSAAAAACASPESARRPQRYVRLGNVWAEHDTGVPCGSGDAVCILQQCVSGNGWHVAKERRGWRVGGDGDRVRCRDVWRAPPPKATTHHGIRPHQILENCVGVGLCGTPANRDGAHPLHQTQRRKRQPTAQSRHTTAPVPPAPPPSAPH